MTDNFELNKVFVTHIGTNPDNGSLQLNLAIINNIEDAEKVLDDLDEKNKQLKIFLDTDTQSVSFQGLEFDAIIKIADIPFSKFKVITDHNHNIFLLYTESLTFNFVSLMNGSYDYLFNFFKLNGFEMITFAELEQQAN